MRWQLQLLRLRYRVVVLGPQQLLPQLTETQPAKQSGQRRWGRPPLARPLQPLGQPQQLLQRRWRWQTPEQRAGQHPPQRWLPA